MFSSTGGTWGKEIPSHQKTEQDLVEEGKHNVTNWHQLRAGCQEWYCPGLAEDRHRSCQTNPPKQVPAQVKMSTKTGPTCCTLRCGSPGAWLPMPLVQGSGNFAATDFQGSIKHGWMLLSMPRGTGSSGLQPGFEFLTHSKERLRGEDVPHTWQD